MVLGQYLGIENLLYTECKSVMNRQKAAHLSIICKDYLNYVMISKKKRYFIPIQVLVILLPPPNPEIMNLNQLM